MERRDDALLQRLCQIDEQIPAADEVDPGERRIGGHVLFRKQAHLADRLVDAVLVVFPDEKPAQALGRDFARDVLRVEPFARLLQRMGVGEVGREDLDCRTDSPVVEIFCQGDRQ